ncbi:MAG: bacteriohopanetetrol glucosamine biosynthesis glycosyltransferase HpnI [Candidatus Eremiobacteraeota bacterium]|nr:bacteriohopanetetrol glucosamine biosynthesis glycosyltransferase HpnI [Candidatus Eremiobacteraeota bacterium]
MIPASILLVVTIASTFYVAIAVVRVAAFLMRPLEIGSEFLPSISILKPIAGLEPELYENLRSACDQDYGAPYEVVLALHADHDPATPIARRLAAEFPAIARIAIGENTAILNPKIANLAKAGAEPRGEIVVIADSDIRAGRDYLKAMAASFATEEIGAATCLYRGIPNASLVSRLGAMQIEDVFIPSVLVALALGELRFCLGATMAARRSLLERTGGLEALGETIADDHRLGELVAAQGKQIDLSRYVVATTVPETTLRELWSHELRWARTNFALAPVGYAFSFLMYALPWTIAYLAVSRNLTWGLPLLAVAVGLRLGLHYFSRAALGVARSGDGWLIPLRDFLSLAVWFASLFGRTVRWRGRSFAPRLRSG